MRELYIVCWLLLSGVLCRRWNVFERILVLSSNVNACLAIVFYCTENVVRRLIVLVPLSVEMIEPIVFSISATCSFQAGGRIGSWQWLQ